jgi:multidrug transporter EmrE-like cation transporter
MGKIIGFEKACDSVSREVSYNILTGFGILMKLVKSNWNTFKRNLQ